MYNSAIAPTGNSTEPARPANTNAHQQLSEQSVRTSKSTLINAYLAEKQKDVATRIADMSKAMKKVSDQLSSKL